MEKYVFSIIGGDKRNINLKALLEQDGHTVKAYGFSKYKEEVVDSDDNLKEAIESSNYIIGGTPLMSDNNLITAPFSDANIRAEELIDSLSSKQVLIGGAISKEIHRMAKEKNITVLDILKHEQMSLLNAIPTAEGVIKIIIEETDTTLNSSDVMVIGYGRTGKVLCKMLSGIGANVTAIVDTYTAKAEAEGLGHKAIMYKQINDYLPKMDTIVNTVPSTVIDKNNFNYIRETSLVIDIASPPFGVDYCDSKNYGIKVLWARALPGKIASKSAAIYIRDTIYSIAI